MLARRLAVARQYAGVKLSRTLNRNLSGPFVVYVEVTKKCNLRCQFCDIWRARPELTGELEFPDFVQLAAELKDLGAIAIVLFGGEALLRADVFDIIRLMKRSGLFVALDSNGYLLPQFHRQIEDAGTDMLVVSLDSSREAVADLLRGLPGNFRRTLEGLRLVNPRQSRMRVVINTLVMQANYRELLDIVKLGADLGVRHFRLLAVNMIYPYNLKNSQSPDLTPTPVQMPEVRQRLEEVMAYCRRNKLSLNPHSFVRKIPDVYLGRPEAVQCYSGYASLNIWNDGRVGSCVGIPDGLGNVRSGGLKRIWYSPEFRRQRTEIASAPCNKCYVACHMETNLWFSLGYLLSRTMGGRC